ncbi:bifunctional DNA primase/polymerase, partial [Verrucomicrobiota bacterium]
MNETPFLAAALKAIAKGTPVFPCGERQKTPLTPHGFLDATTDETIVRQWWTRWPTANLAVPTGERSGLIVLDVDDEAALSELTAEHGPLPATLQVKTPSGGRHLYFRRPGQKIPTRT